MSGYFSICPASGKESQVGEVSSPRTGNMGGRKCACSTGKAVGLAALATGIAMVVMAAIMASGLFGGGHMYFVAAGLTVGSIIPFSIAAYFLKCKEPKYRTLGSLEAVREQI